MSLTLLKINAAIIAASNAYDIKPELIHAIVKVESGYHQFAVGSSHGEIGLMQLRPEFHECASFKIWDNIHCGVKYLAFVRDKKEHEWGDAWFVAYNYGPYSQLDNPQNTLYYKKIKEAL